MTQLLLNSGTRRLGSFGFIHIRHCPTVKKSLQKKATSNPNEAEEVKTVGFYVMSSYLRYVKNFAKVVEIMERCMPGPLRVYRVFSKGIRVFITDLKQYFRVVRLVHAPEQRDKFRSLTRRDIELYHQMPKDLRQVAPVLVITSVPIVCYMIFPIAYVFPRHLLSPHFWNLEQRSNFNSIILKKRLEHSEPILRSLQDEMVAIKNHKLYKEWSDLLGLLGSGFRLRIDQILRCEELFACPPYHINHLKRHHVRHLIKLHDFHTGLFKRTRLSEKAMILREMDRAIMREGGVHGLSREELKNACFIRGLHAVDMRKEDMIKWLNNWITISSAVDKETLSLLLHCPVLLAYNEPTNWQLLYYKKSEDWGL